MALNPEDPAQCEKVIALRDQWKLRTRYCEMRKKNALTNEEKDHWHALWIAAHTVLVPLELDPTRLMKQLLEEGKDLPEAPPVEEE